MPSIIIVWYNNPKFTSSLDSRNAEVQQTPRRRCLHFLAAETPGRGLGSSDAGRPGTNTTVSNEVLVLCRPCYLPAHRSPRPLAPLVALGA